MNSKTLFIYSSVDGHTLKISNRLVEILTAAKIPVDLVSIEELNHDISEYNKVIIGASIRYGVHNKKIIDFINTHKEELDRLKTAFFSVNLVARKPEKSSAETNPYVVKFFKSITWRPTITEVFAGMLDYQKYPFFDRIMIQFIMWMTKGPTNADAKIEYTNWEKVEKFGKTLIDL